MIKNPSYCYSSKINRLLTIVTIEIGVLILSKLLSCDKSSFKRSRHFIRDDLEQIEIRLRLLKHLESSFEDLTHIEPRLISCEHIGVHRVDVYNIYLPLINISPHLDNPTCVRLSLLLIDAMRLSIHD